MTLNPEPPISQDILGEVRPPSTESAQLTLHTQGPLCPSQQQSQKNQEAPMATGDGGHGYSLH